MAARAKRRSREHMIRRRMHVTVRPRIIPRGFPPQADTKVTIMCQAEPLGARPSCSLPSKTRPKSHPNLFKLDNGREYGTAAAAAAATAPLATVATATMPASPTAAATATTQGLLFWRVQSRVSGSGHDGGSSESSTIEFKNEAGPSIW